MKTEEVYKLIEETRKEMKAECQRIEDKADKIFVKLETFEPIRKLVYGFVGLALLAVASSLIALVVRIK